MMEVSDDRHVDNNDTEVRVLQVAGCPPLNIRGLFDCRDNIVIHAAKFGHASNEKLEVPDGGWRVMSFCWNPTSLHVPCVRRLYNEAATVFASLNRQLPLPETAATPAVKPQAAVFANLLSHSRRYRACMRAAIESVEEGRCADAESRAFSQILLQCDMVWHLCEIIYIDQHKGSSLLHQLVSWLKFHCPYLDQLVANVLTADSCDSHPDYWNAVYACTLQARIDDARKLLRLSTNYGVSEAFASADELLHKMPPALMTDGASGGDLEYRWRHWQDECIRRQESGEFDYFPRLRSLVKILCGDAETFEDLAELMGGWYHLMVSYLIFTKPWATKMDVRAAAQDAVAACPGVPWHALDSLLLSCCQLDPARLLHVAMTTLADAWLPAHLADLLCRQQLQLSQLLQLREQLLGELGGQLMAQKQLWQLGAVYLERGGVRTRATLPLYLQRVPPKTERTAHKIIQFAESRRLPALAASVARVLGLRSLRRGRQGAALAWAVRGQDATLAAHLADTMARHCSRTGCVSALELIDSLGPAVLISDRLMFLGKYREFRRLCAEDRLKEAGELLVALMVQQLAPEYFWLTLLDECVPLLQSARPVVSLQHTTQLLHCLDSLQLDQDKLSEDRDQVFRIRKAICDNMARSYIEQHSAA